MDVACLFDKLKASSLLGGDARSVEGHSGLTGFASKAPTNWPRYTINRLMRRD